MVSGTIKAMLSGSCRMNAFLRNYGYIYGNSAP